LLATFQIETKQIQATIDQSTGIVSFGTPSLVSSASLMKQLENCIDRAQYFGRKLEQFDASVQLDTAYIQHQNSVERKPRWPADGSGPSGGEESGFELGLSAMAGISTTEKE
jgi:hypothetical protein